MHNSYMVYTLISAFCSLWNPFSSVGAITTSCGIYMYIYTFIALFTKTHNIKYSLAVYVYGLDMLFLRCYINMYNVHFLSVYICFVVKFNINIWFQTFILFFRTFPTVFPTGWALLNARVKCLKVLCIKLHSPVCFSAWLFLIFKSNIFYSNSPLFWLTRMSRHKVF